VSDSEPVDLRDRESYSIFKDMGSFLHAGQVLGRCVGAKYPCSVSGKVTIGHGAMCGWRHCCRAVQSVETAMILNTCADWQEVSPTRI
jgi:hypothetical protein